MSSPVFDVVADFGADPTGGVSSDVAFRNFCAAVKSAGRQPARGPGAKGGVGLIPNGTYVGLTSYDMTLSNGFLIKGASNYGSVMYADGQTGNSKPVFDMSGSNASAFRDVSINGTKPDGSAPAVLPSCGILMAATSAGDDCNKNEVSTSGIGGYFSSAALAIVGATDNVFNFVEMMQVAGPQGIPNSPPALMISSRPDWGVSSPYVTINAGPVNVGDNTFNQCEVHTRNSGAGWPTYFRDAGIIRFFGGNSSCANGGLAHALFQGTCQSISYFGTQFWTEAAPPAAYLFQTQSGSVNRLICVGCDESGAYGGARLNGSFTGFVWQ